MPLTPPPAVFTPPSTPPAEAAAVFANPGIPTPSAAGAVFVIPTAGSPSPAIATITLPGGVANLSSNAGIQINGQGGPIGPLVNKSAAFIVDNILEWMWGDPTKLDPGYPPATYGYVIDFSVSGNVITLSSRPGGAAGNAWTISKFGTSNNLTLSAGFSGGSDSAIAPPPVIYSQP